MEDKGDEKMICGRCKKDIGMDAAIVWVLRVPYHSSCTGPPDIRTCQKCQKNIDVILDDYVKKGDERWCISCHDKEPKLVYL